MNWLIDLPGSPSIHKSKTSEQLLCSHPLRDIDIAHTASDPHPLNGLTRVSKYRLKGILDCLRQAHLSVVNVGYERLRSINRAVNLQDRDRLAFPLATVFNMLGGGRELLLTCIDPVLSGQAILNLLIKVDGDDDDPRMVRQD